MTYLLQSTNLSQLKKDKHRRTNTRRKSILVILSYQNGWPFEKSRHFVYARSLKPYPKTVSME